MKIEFKIALIAAALALTIGISAHAQQYMAPASSVPATSAAPLYYFNTDLTLGSRGQDVVQLQTWLMNNGYDIPAVRTGLTPKGYFGIQTKQALARYQLAVGLNANGYFGPLTRAKIRGGAGGGGGGGVIQPPSTALRVISPNGGETFVKNQYQMISWTGSSAIMSQTGSIWLTYYTPPCAQEIAGQPHCMIAVRAPELIVRNAPLGSGSYRWYPSYTSTSDCPTCGVPAPIPDGQYKIQICSADNSACDMSDDYFTLTSYPVPSSTPTPYPYPTTQAPVILGVDAPTTLNVGQGGIWTVRATDPMNGSLSYSVDWGDTARPLYGGASTASAGGQFVQSTTFNHSYSTTGIFTVTFTVRNSSGLIATSKTTVSIGLNNPSQPISVISPNGNEIWKRGSTQTISWNNYGSNYQYQQPSGYVRVTLDYQCPSNYYCTALYRPPYIIQNSAPNGGSSNWLVGSATTDGVNATQVPAGTYIMTICKFDTSGQQGGCDSSDSYFTITD